MNAYVELSPIIILITSIFADAHDKRFGHSMTQDIQLVETTHPATK